jgi:hypothetical protein
MMRAAVIAALGLVLTLVTNVSANDGVMSERPAYTARVTVIAERGLETLGRELEARAEAELTEIAADLVDLPLPKTVEIHLVDDASSLASVAPEGRGAPPWAIGVAYPDLGVLSVATRRGSHLVDPVSTLRHELAHVALGAALGDHAPHWLHEGFAYQHSAEWSWDRTETLAGMSWFGGLVPLDELDRSFPAEELPANRAYAESYDFVGYLSRRGRHEETDDDGDRAPFRRFLTALGHNQTIDAAAIRAFGKPIHALFDEWRDSVHQRYLWAPIGLLSLAVWIFCALLLVLGYLRRRRHNRRRLAEWELNERRDDQARGAGGNVVFAPPYVPWPGIDPLDDEPDEDAGEPRLPN